MPPAAPRTARSFLGPPSAAPSSSSENPAVAVAVASHPTPPHLADPSQPSAQPTQQNETGGSASPHPRSPSSHISNFPAPQPHHHRPSRLRSRSPDIPMPVRRGLRRSPRRAAARETAHTADAKPENTSALIAPPRKDAATLATRRTSAEASAESATAIASPRKPKMEPDHTEHASEGVPTLSPKAAALAVDAARAAASARGEGDRLGSVTPLVTADTKESPRVVACGKVSTNVSNNVSMATAPQNAPVGQTQGEQGALMRSSSDTIVKSTASASQIALRRNMSRASRFSSANDTAPLTGISANNPTSPNSANQMTSGITRAATSPNKHMPSEPRGMVKLSGNRIVKVSDSLRRTNSAPVTGRASAAAVRLSVGSAPSISSSASSSSRPVPGARMSTELAATILAQGKVNSIYSRAANTVAATFGNETRRAPDVVVPPNSPIPRANAPNIVIPPDAPIPRTRTPAVIVPPNAPIPRSRPPQVVIPPSAPIPRNRSPTVPPSRPLVQPSSHQVASRLRSAPLPAPTSSLTMPPNSMRSSEPASPRTQVRPSVSTLQNVFRSPVNIPFSAPARVPRRDPRVRPNTARAAAAKAEAARTPASTVIAKPQVDQFAMPQMQGGSAQPVPASTAEHVGNSMGDVHGRDGRGAFVPAPQPRPLSAEEQARIQRDRRLLAAAGRRTVAPGAPNRQKGAPSRSRFRNGAAVTSVGSRDGVTSTASAARVQSTGKPSAGLPVVSMGAQAVHATSSHGATAKEEHFAPSVGQPVAPGLSASGTTAVKQMAENTVANPGATVGGNVVASDGERGRPSRFQQQPHPHAPQQTQTYSSLSQQGQGVVHQRFQPNPKAPGKTYNMASVPRFEPQSRVLVAPSAEKKAFFLQQQQARTSLPLQGQANPQLQGQQRPASRFQPEPKVQQQVASATYSPSRPQTALNQQTVPSALAQSQAHLHWTQANVQARQQNQSANILPGPSYAVQSTASAGPGSSHVSTSSFEHSAMHGSPAGSWSATAVPTSAPVQQHAAVSSTVPNEITAAVPVATGHSDPAETDTPVSTGSGAAPAFSVRGDQPPTYRGRGTGRPRGRPRGSKAKAGGRGRGRARGAKTRASTARGGSQSSPLESTSSSMADIGGLPPDTDSTSAGAGNKDIAVSSGAIDRPRRGRQKGQTKKQKELERIQAEKDEQRKREIELDDEARKIFTSYLAKRGKTWISNYGRISPPETIEPPFKRHRSLSPPRLNTDIAGSSQQARPSSAPVPLVGSSNQHSLPLTLQNLNPVANTAPQPPQPPRAPQPLSMSRLGNLALTLQGPPTLTTLTSLSLTGPGRISVNIAPKPRPNRYTMVSPSHLGVLVPPRPRAIASPAKLTFSVEPSPAPPRSILRPNQLSIGRNPTPRHTFNKVASPTGLSVDRAPVPRAWSVVNVGMEDSVNVTPTPRRQPEFQTGPQSLDIAPLSKRLDFAKEVVSHERIQMPRMTPTKRFFSRGVSAVPESDARPSLNDMNVTRYVNDDFSGVDVPDGRIPRRRQWTGVNTSPGINKTPTGLRSQPRNIESQGSAPIAGSPVACTPSTGRHAVLQRPQTVREEVVGEPAERERANVALKATEVQRQLMFNKHLNDHAAQGNATDSQALNRAPRTMEPFQSLVEKQVLSPLPAMNLYDRVKAKNAERSPITGKRQFNKASPKASPRRSPPSKRPRTTKSPTAVAKPSNKVASMQELRVLTPRPPSLSPNSRSFSLGSPAGGLVTTGSSNGGPSSVARRGAQSNEIAVAQERDANGVSRQEGEGETEKFGCLCDYDVDVVPADVVAEVHDMDWHGIKPINFWKWRLLLHSHLCEHAAKSTEAFPERKAQLEEFAALPFTKLLETVQESVNAVESC